MLILKSICICLSMAALGLYFLVVAKGAGATFVAVCGLLIAMASRVAEHSL